MKSLKSVQENLSKNNLPSKKFINFWKKKKKKRMGEAMQVCVLQFDNLHKPRIP